MSEDQNLPDDLEDAIDQATEAVAVESAQLDELADSAASGPGLGMGNLMDVPVRVTVEIGRKRVTLSELARMGPGALLVLEREAHEPADILVNGKVVARGEIVTVDGSYGVRVTEVLGGEG
ncbi:MAG TPA: flagellar motor switch protein FliN [Planctomycetota bacterium]|nr:flagellar motor switch protein FliN [Planctomycetota bacterium]